jgi:hypothetical protein
MCQEPGQDGSGFRDAQAMQVQAFLGRQMAAPQLLKQAILHTRPHEPKFLGGLDVQIREIVIRFLPCYPRIRRQGDGGQPRFEGFDLFVMMPVRILHGFPEQRPFVVIWMVAFLGHRSGSGFLMDVPEIY